MKTNGGNTYLGITNLYKIEKACMLLITSMNVLVLIQLLSINIVVFIPHNK